MHGCGMRHAVSLQRSPKAQPAEKGAGHGSGLGCGGSSLNPPYRPPAPQRGRATWAAMGAHQVDAPKRFCGCLGAADEPANVKKTQQNKEADRWTMAELSDDVGASLGRPWALALGSSGSDYFVAASTNTLL